MLEQGIKDPIAYLETIVKKLNKKKRNRKRNTP
jgi:hypothetical protein